MKNFILLLFLSISFLVGSAAPPPDADRETTTEVAKQDGTVSVSKAFDRDWEVPGKHTDVVISVDELQGVGNLYASLSSFPQDETEVVETETTEVAEDDDGDFSLGDFLGSYWLELLMALMVLLKVIVNLTPTEKDNKVFAWLDNILNAIIPNYSSDGGTHTTTSE
jgi:hypothetical protein